MKFPVPTQADLDAALADCPECEYCCIIGACCPPARQFIVLVAVMAKATGSSVEECARHAQAVVDARLRAQQKHEA
ncbi:MAG: hypothetical protein V4597_08635 [Pseudomonadota bacterium]